MPGKYFINRQIIDTAQSVDRVPPAIVCVIDFHFLVANMKGNFLTGKYFFFYVIHSSWEEKLYEKLKDTNLSQLFTIILSYASMPFYIDATLA
ncbi:MAG: hypothetical protein M3015_02975 [Bacteroidota bacterium]|nr:hypothetical protein [Bacteroidota bacterium]